MISIDFYGRVQGVGFRFFILEKANKYKLIGFVKNESDGSVHLECKNSNLIDEFLEEIKKEHPGHIDKINIEKLKIEKNFNSFCIVF